MTTATTDDQPIILVEGQMDVISSHQAGFTTTVGSSGTSVSRDQLNLCAAVMNPLLFDLERRTWTDWYRFSRGYYYVTDGGIELMDDWTISVYGDREREWRRTRPRNTGAMARREFFPQSVPQGRGPDAKEVKASCDVVAVYLALGGTPPRFPNRDKVAVRCLLHGEDRRPSATLYRDGAGYHCHNCHFGNDVFDLTQQVLGVSFSEAVKFVSDVC